MRVAVYAIGHEGKWRIRRSLDLRVDVLWWGQRFCAKPGFARIVLLSAATALSSAVRLEQRFEPRTEMSGWDLRKWGLWFRERMEEEAGRGMNGDAAVGGQALFGGSGEVLHSGTGVWMWDFRQAMPEQVLRLLERPAGPGQAAGALAELGGMSDALVARVSGRSLLAAEVDALLQEMAPCLAGAWHSAAQLASLQGRLALDAGLADAGPRRGGGLLRMGRPRLPRCRRCGSEATGRTPCAACGRADCAYCEACLALGRSRACSLLLRSAARDPAVRAAAGPSTAAVRGRWGLSAAQGDAACAALGFLAEPPRRGSAAPGGRAERPLAPARHARFLLWAVTGAGKTEMIFPLLGAILEKGGRVLVATPRRDVVLELAPRLAKAFPDTRIVTLYGGSDERWREGDLTLATTHQLMRFYQAFDLVVIDELDALPCLSIHTRLFVGHALDGCRYEFPFSSASPI